MDEQHFLITTLTQVANALEKANVQFALVGGLAFSALVQPRATVDIDILVLAGEDDRPSLLRAIAPLFDGVIPHQETMKLSGARIWRVVCIKGKREIIVDFLWGEEDFHKQALSRRKAVKVLGASVYIVSAEDLYLLKVRSGRPQDKVDIANIEAHYGPELDQAYIQSWLHKWHLPPDRS